MLQENVFHFSENLTLEIPNYESQNRDPMRPSETQIGFEKKMTFRTLEPQKVL